jgi:8-oxo-dGTP pyrophosphatase MutT (NUDIX family)
VEVVTPLVRAAGGIVSRPGQDGGTEVLLVHRPAYDDWTFPKGKAQAGESDEMCALREVEEETGFRCAIGREAGEVRYLDPRGRPKVVRYFGMRPVGGRLQLLREVDDARWLSTDEAAERLTYDHDRDLLRAFTLEA